MFGGASGIEGYADWGSLPDGHGAGGIGSEIFHFSFLFSFCNALGGEEFLEHGLATGDLRDDGVEFLAIVGNAAVGSVVTVPTGDGVEGVKLGKVEGGNVSGGLVYEKPSTALPLPVRRSGGFLGKAVINPESAADYEQAVGEVVNGPESEFLDVGVDQERPNFQGEGLAVC